jgi:hypothetical protein
MTITPNEFEKRFPGRRKPISAKFAGQWIAWDSNRDEVVAHGASAAQVRRDACAAGHADPILQKIPRGPFVGGA